MTTKRSSAPTDQTKQPVDYGRVTWNSRSSAGTAGWSEIFSPNAWLHTRFTGFSHGGSESQEVKALSRRWAEAELAGDADWLDNLLLDDFVAVGPRGELLTREQWLARHRSGKVRYQQFNWGELHVRVHHDTAIVLGCEQTHATWDGRATTTSPALRVLQVFVRLDDRWRMAAIQHSPLVAEFDLTP